MVEVLTDIYATGLVLYTLLQLTVGNFAGTGRLTVTWLNNRTFRFPSAYATIPLCLLWFIALPAQIYQHLVQVRRFKRERAARHARYDGRY